MMTISEEEESEYPPHDRLSCTVEEFDYDMHVYICNVLYNQDQELCQSGL